MYKLSIPLKVYTVLTYKVLAFTNNLLGMNNVVSKKLAVYGPDVCVKNHLREILEEKRTHLHGEQGWLVKVDKGFLREEQMLCRSGDRDLKAVKYGL